MAISKLILNGETQMDVTSNTNTSNNMLSGVVGTKNDGTTVTGSIASKSSSDLTVSGATVTAPAGYYANAASKAVATVAHPDPTAVLTSSTGMIVAGHTQETGYVTGGTTTTMLNLTTQTAKTVTPTESIQTAVPSYRWTTGNVNVAAISSTYVGTGIPKYSAGDLTTSGSGVTVLTGYYSSTVTKLIAAGSAFPPAVTITKAPTIGVNTSGVITASYNGSSSITPTVTSGYISQGTAGTVSTTGTSTYQLTSQAATTYYPSTADQTIASQRWLVGNQTIKSVTTSNLTAANIAEGVVVKVGDANNASRITQITGTHSGATSYTATISEGGNSSYCYVSYNGTKYYYNGSSFTFKAGDTLTIYCRGNYLDINGSLITLSNYSYNYTLPIGDINIVLNYANSTNNEICITTYLVPSGTLSVSDSGDWYVYQYENAYVRNGRAFPPATTITTNPAFSMNSATGVVTASYTGSSSITPTVISGWISQGTSGIISTTGTNIYQLPTQSAMTYYPSTADQTISSYRWLIGVQTIKSVTTTNLTANNIAEGVTVEVGTPGDTSRITQITGTYTGGEYYSVYQAIVDNTILSYNIIGFDSYIMNLSSVKSQMFEDRQFNTGTYEFTNTNIIGRGAFACPTRTTWNFASINFIFPSCSDVGSNAFASRQYLYSINAPVCTNIGNNAFVSCYSLTTISFPSCTYIGPYAFQSCSSLTTASFPSCSYIGAGAFSYCSSLITADFPACTDIGSSAFVNCYSLTTISFPACTSIRYNAFGNCSSLIIASFPSCTNIVDHAFRSCYSLTTISFPSCTNIGGGAFAYCFSLTTISFPSCTNIGGSAFSYCSLLTTADFPACTNIGAGAFAYCYSLTTVDFPACTTIEDYAFSGCLSLTTISFPVCTTIGNYAFYSCRSLSTVNFPACINISAYAFSNCINLTTASFSACTNIGSYAFRYCYNLLSLYLLGSSIPTLASTNAFISTPISTYTTSTGGVYGSIFVPASLYSSYLTATNWSVYSSRIVSVQGG